jgi:hypothetical protein
MTNLLRAALQPRVVRPIFLVALGTTLLCAAVVLGISLSRFEIVVAAPPVIVPPVIVPPAQVTVEPTPVVMPPTPVVVEPPAAPTPAPPPPPQPRAVVPMLDPACVIVSYEETSPTCAWDDGFPAISADGTLIAMKYSPPMGQSELYGLSIRFIDTKTRVVRDHLILTPEELGSILYPQDAEPPNVNQEDKQQQRREHLMRKIQRRVAAVQRTLDAKRFRPLLALGSADDSPDDPPSQQRGPHPVYAEIVGTIARIIDSAASQVLWRGEFWVDRPEPAEDGADCASWWPRSIELWWDPKTRNVLAMQTYRTGSGCMCPDVAVETVTQMR